MFHDVDCDDVDGNNKSSILHVDVYENFYFRLLSRLVHQVHVLRRGGSYYFAFVKKTVFFCKNENNVSL